MDLSLFELYLKFMIMIYFILFKFMIKYLFFKHPQVPVDTCGYEKNRRVSA